MSKRPGHQPKTPAVREAPSLPSVRTSNTVWIIFSALLVFSAVLGVVCVIQYLDSPSFNRPQLDERSYVRWALEVAQNDFWGNKIFYQDPLYPYFLALLFKIFGMNFLAVRLCQVMMGTASVALVFGSARKLFDDRVALLAAAMLAVYRGLYFFELQIIKSSLEVLLSAASCYLGVLAAEKPEARRRWLAAGASLGLLAELRGNFIPILPFFIIWALMVRRREHGFFLRAKRAALLALGLALVILPVTARNYAVGREIVLTTSQGGANFFIGNSPYADGRYAELPFVRPDPAFEADDFQAEAERRVGRQLRPSQVSRFWFKEGWQWDLEHPGPAFKLILHKARLLVHQFEVADNYDFYLTRERFAPAMWVSFLGFGLLWGPALLGMWSRRRDPRAWYPALFGWGYAASIIPFFIVDRYRMALVPAAIIFSAGAIPWLTEKILSRELKALLPAGLFIAGSLLLSFWPTLESRQPHSLGYYNLANTWVVASEPEKAMACFALARQGLGPAETEVRAMIAEGEAQARQTLDLMAAAQTETEPDQLYQIGNRLEESAQFELAVRIYEQIARRNPDYLPAQGSLGYLYCQAPDLRDRDQAMTHLNHALDLAPDNLQIMLLLGECHHTLGDHQAARRWFEKILARQPDFEPARKNLMELEKEGR